MCMLLGGWEEVNRRINGFVLKKMKNYSDEGSSLIKGEGFVFGDIEFSFILIM